MTLTACLPLLKTLSALSVALAAPDPSSVGTLSDAESVSSLTNDVAPGQSKDFTIITLRLKDPAVILIVVVRTPLKLGNYYVASNRLS